MTWLDGLQKAVVYMEEHLHEKITIAEIAKVANISPFHFQRAFSILTNITIGEYLRRRRLSLAAEEILELDVKVVDLAYKYGYETPEAFTKAFRKQHGMTPTETRKGVGKLTYYNPLVIQVSLKGAEPMNVKVMEKEAFRVIGVKRSYSFTNDENLREIPLLWNEVNVNGTTDTLAEKNNGKVSGILGICIENSADKTKDMDYWVAAASEEEVTNFDAITIPASKWAVFEVNGPMPESMQKVWKQIYTEWYPTSGYQRTGSPELEVYPDKRNPASPDYYSEIWIPVKL